MGTNQAATTVTKSIDRIFLLRVSGQGDDGGNAGQFQMLQEYTRFDDVTEFASGFDVRMMKSSSREGARLRERWVRRRGMRVLTRAGRSDFLGVSVVVGRTRFIVYGSTAAKMDEPSGNAFTRLVCEAIRDPAFSGMADPDFMARRDAGSTGDGHPSVVYAFDPTRFCRSVTSATLMYDTAASNLVAFEARDLFIDPAQGDHMKIWWTFLAYGSEMEATVGKLRRFVGRLNLARAGFWPYRPGMAPLGATCAGERGARTLVVDAAHVASVARLARLGLDLGVSNSQILRVLGTEHAVVSTDPKTLGVPVQNLDPAAAKRLFVRRKLEAYRDGELAMTFIGVMENSLRPGSGHVLTRRWFGLDQQGQPDRYGAITYRIPMPRPMVTGPDGQPRSGWIDGVTDEQEQAMWNRLILLRGVDDEGRRPDPDQNSELWASLSGPERDALTKQIERASRRARGGRPGSRVVSVICPAYRDDPGGPDSPRTFLRVGSGGSRVALRQEKAPGREGRGLRRRESRLLASFREEALTGAVAELITLGVRGLTDDGYELAPHQVRMTRGLAEDVERADPTVLRDSLANALREEAAEQLVLARGYDRQAAVERGSDHPILARAEELEDRARMSWAAHRAKLEQAQAAERTAVPGARTSEVPPLDFSDPRDIVVGLRGVYSTGPVPAGFLDALGVLLPTGVRFERGTDMLEWCLTGDVTFSTTTGDTVTLTGCRVPIRSVMGKGAGGGSAQRAAALTARRMVAGDPVGAVASAGGLTQPAQAARLMSAHLNRTGRFPDPALLQLALDCPIRETTRILHDHATAHRPPRVTGFAAHVVSVYTQPPPPPSARAARRTGQGRVWAYSLTVDRRIDQLTIVQAATARGGSLTASALAELLTPIKPRGRHVLTASTATQRQGAPYPPVLRRLPAPGHPAGWYGRDAGSLPDEQKAVGLVLCPHTDCPEQYATVLCPAVEVLALGAMLICRRCRRAATPPDHTAFPVSRSTRFPQAYLDWSDAQPRATGQIVTCAAADCMRDVGFGPGLTWRWDQDPEARAWHDAECRAGQVTGTFTPCGFVDCRVDEGGGPGRIRQHGRGRRTWHARDCQVAETRRLRAAATDFATCIWTGCAIDEGAGPGSIAKRGRHRTAHTAQCRAAARRATSAGT